MNHDHLADIQARYQQDGYVLLENFIRPDLLAALQTTTADFTARAGELSGEYFDVVPASDGKKRLRRIIDPEKTARVYRQMMMDEKLLDVVAHLLGGSVRFDHAKMNFKPPVEGTVLAWHQDWAFYPHTNDDMLAVGVFIADCTPANGPLMVIPGSHQGVIYDHHKDGAFVGGIATSALPAEEREKAVTLTAAAGAISIHHVRTLHASAANSGDKDRPLLLYNYAAVDAFPILHGYDWDEFNRRILRGTPTFSPRLAAVPARVPYPAAVVPDGQYSTASIYDLQDKIAAAK